MQLADLLSDVFTFLCFLHAGDVAPRGPRWLPPKALARLNAQLLLADEVELAPPSQPAGKRGTTERETERIRFIHFLCEAAGLVALTGRFLKPTPHTARWLELSSHEQVSQLFAAAFPIAPDRAHDKLWRTYHLPTWQHASPSLGLVALRTLLQNSPPGSPIELSTLAEQALPPSDDEETQLVLRQMARQLAHYLEWFQAIKWEGPSAFHLTAWGGTLLGCAESPALPELPPGLVELSAVDEETGELHQVEFTAAWPALYELSEYAGLLAVRPRRHYRLDRTRIHRALERSTSISHIRTFLDAVTSQASPPPIDQLLEHWARDSDRVTLRHVVLLEARKAADLAQLANERRVRDCIERTLSPRIVVVRPERLAALIRRLERRGLSPRVDFPRSEPGSRRPGFDRPTLAYLYLSTRLCYQLSDLIPPACRTPYSILLDMERQLGPRDRELAAQLASECADRIRTPRLPRPLQDDECLGISVEGTLAAIERAIQSGSPLELSYYTAYRDQVTTRTVEPHRLEWHGRTPYLIAYCTREQDERTFRVDRIMDLRLYRQ